MVDSNEVSDYINQKQLHLRDKGDKFVGPCPIPGCKDKKNEHFVVYKDSGAWCCIYPGHPGEARGSFKRLKYLLGDYSQVTSMRALSHKEYTHVPSDAMEKPRVNMQMREDMLAALTAKRGLSRAMVEKFGIGLSADGLALVYPYSENGTLVNVKHIKRNADGTKDCWFVKDAKIPLWNVDSVAGKAICAITEGELDCVSLVQLGWDHAAVSLPTGAGGFQPEFTEALSGCNEIWLFYDNDSAGQIGVQKALSALGESRCKVVHLPFKDVNECLQNGLTLSDITHPDIITIPGTSPISRPKKYLDELLDKLGNHEYVKGIGTPFGDLDDICTIRYGTLLSILGGTGAGKSTFATYLAYAWMCEKIPVCIASFEMQKIDIVQQILQTEIEKPYADMTRGDIDDVYDDIAGMPLFILEIFGRAKLGELSKSIRTIRHQYGVRIFIIDSLQFIANTSSAESVSIAMETLNDLCNELQVCIILINHPNRGVGWKSKDADLEMTDSKGGSAIEGISHALWILKRDEETDDVFLTVAKNRINGIINKTFRMFMDPRSKIYSSSGMYTKPKLIKEKKNKSLREAIQQEGLTFVSYSQPKEVGE